MIQREGVGKPLFQGGEPVWQLLPEVETAIKKFSHFSRMKGAEVSFLRKQESRFIPAQAETQAI